MKDKILIVDDEKNILSSLLRVLHDQDYEIFTAEDAVKGLDIVTNNEICLVLSDYNMPIMDGISFLSKVKYISPDTMRLVLSGRSDFEIALSAINKGEVYRFITKPIKPQDLKLTIRQSLDYRKLLLRNGVLSDVVKRQNNLLQELEQQYPGITQVELDDMGAIVIAEEML